jgi:phage baseplate assembly protein W
LKEMKQQMVREINTLKDRDVEMRILAKQAQRERRNEFGSVLFDAIFEIANEAYIH